VRGISKKKPHRGGGGGGGGGLTNFDTGGEVNQHATKDNPLLRRYKEGGQLVDAKKNILAKEGRKTRGRGVKEEEGLSAKR